MSVESTLYALLTADAPLAALVGERIMPTVPTENTPLPFLVFTISDSSPVYSLDGPTGLTRHTLDLDAAGIDQTTALAVLAAVRDILDGYRGGSVQGVFLGGESTAPLDVGYQGAASYSVWATS